ncbi:MAG: thiol:disulfide interchange protein [OM182 bacterium MED-G24]|uniref:Thiol:disulfide interchange protein n=1 Tax=OM182 bacterium MED-G24 TaxID=1986255 RepID=A0A2A5WIG3_9GAMM|nr:MAG: thiol:disulfide interchange protein [OM182 bacterium MED-G24]
MKFVFRLITVFALLLTGIHATYADEEPQVFPELVSEVTAIVPGQPFRVALVQEINPGWHTYWRTPGDSGAATTLEWSLPTGFTAGEIAWPLPERIVYGPLINYGYHDRVVLPVVITPPPDLTPGDQITLDLAAEWLVCADLCIPEDADLSLTMDVAASNEPDTRYAQWFADTDVQVPMDVGMTSGVRFTDEQIVVTVQMPGVSGERVSRLEYFPYYESVIDYPAEQEVSISNDRIEITLAKAFDFEDGEKRLDGIIVIHEDAGEDIVTPIEIHPVMGAGPDATTSGEMGLGLAVLFALVGGAILNLMPCVFPVLSIKILSLVHQVGEDKRQVRAHGWVYLLGVTISFVVIALALVALRAAGEQIGWGFQLQSPMLVALLAYLFFLIGLSLSGYFEIGNSLMNMGSGLADKGGYGGSFATGVLATVVAAPCTAPFMAGAIGFALTQNTAMVIIIFSALGIGMAIPYVALCYSPALMERLPRPGAWMVMLKEALAFPMFASTVWLVWVLSQQTGANGVLSVLLGLVAITFGIWLFRHLPSGTIGRGLVSVLAVASIVSALALTTVEGSAGAEPTTGKAAAAVDGPVPETYSPDRLAELRTEGPVFVNFTAAWCITCKVNEQVALSSSGVANAFADGGVSYLKGDWTNEDPVITNALAEYERSGVPLYLLYAPGEARARVLPQVLTESIIIGELSTL